MGCGPDVTSHRRPRGRPAGGLPVADRDRVLDAAEEVIRRVGPDVSLSSIAEAAGITKPSVYARVGGRQELATALAARFTERLVDATRTEIADAATGRDALVATIRVALDHIDRHRELFLYVTAGNTSNDRLSLAKLAVEPLTRQLSRWGEASERRPVSESTAEAWSVAVVGMIDFVALWWTTNDARPSDVLADQLADLLWTGLAGRPPASDATA